MVYYRQSLGILVMDNHLHAIQDHVQPHHTYIYRQEHILSELPLHIQINLQSMEQLISKCNNKNHKYIIQINKNQNQIT